MAEVKEKLILRHERLAFMNVSKDGAAASYKRMTGFTEMAAQKNPEEYSRQYIDRPTESTDVVGYSPAISYSFDAHKGNEVHEIIMEISDNEMLGSDTHVEIVSVDTWGTEASKPATMRTYSVIPDNDGSEPTALIYSGTFRAVSDIVKGTATSNDGWKTATFTPATA